MQNKSTYRIVLLLIPFTMLLFGCSFTVKKEELTNAQKGFYKGAITCGVIGAVVDDDNRLRGAAVGAATCGIIGAELGKRKDKKENKSK